MLKNQLQTELNQALKAGDQLKRSVLGMVITAIKNQELAKRGRLSKTVTDPVALAKQSQLDETEIQQVLASEVKKRKEALEQFAKVGRTELAAKEKAELEILQAYRPAQLDETRVRAVVQSVIAQNGAKDIKQMGVVIGQVMAKLQGQADGGTVSRIVKEELSK